MVRRGRVRHRAGPSFVPNEELDADHGPAATQQEEHPVGAGEARDVTDTNCADRQADDPNQDSNPAGSAETLASFLHGRNVRRRWIHGR
jgi:hypothetical protein